IFPLRLPAGFCLNKHKEPFGIILFIDSPTTKQANKSSDGRVLSGIATQSKPSISCDSLNPPAATFKSRSEEHTSELQSRFDLVCRLLLEKKNNKSTL